MTKKGLFYIIFFVGITLAFYLFIKKYISRTDTISVVQPFSFVNQDGKTVTNTDVEGKVYVADYFFTTCKGICPKMNENMRKVYEKYQNTPGFLILSHTCDPDTDSVPVLKRFTDSMKINTSKWIFVTGKKDELYKIARLSYTIDDPANNLNDIKDDFLHTQFWALVNKKGEVKKIYDGLKQKEVEALISDIEKQLKAD